MCIEYVSFPFNLQFLLFKEWSHWDVLSLSKCARTGHAAKNVLGGNNIKKAPPRQQHLSFCLWLWQLAVPRVR
mgnify:CR=1 FL=1